MNDQPERPVETPDEWVRYAEGDLGVAEREMCYQTPAYHTICFLCQSAAEKFLKGYLIAQGWTLEKTHDVVQLLGLCAEYDADLGAMIVEGAILNEYVVAGRYPGDLAVEYIGRAEAKEALDATQCIRARVGKLMGFLIEDENGALED
jgi:HEPN domain-containing protein